MYPNPRIWYGHLCCLKISSGSMVQIWLLLLPIDAQILIWLTDRNPYPKYEYLCRCFRLPAVHHPMRDHMKALAFCGHKVSKSFCDCQSSWLKFVNFANLQYIYPLNVCSWLTWSCLRISSTLTFSFWSAFSYHSQLGKILFNYPSKACIYSSWSNSLTIFLPAYILLSFWRDPRFAQWRLQQRAGTHCWICCTIKPW